MPTALRQFEREGIKVIPALMGFYQKEQFTPLTFILVLTVFGMLVVLGAPF